MVAGGRVCLARRAQTGVSRALDVAVLVIGVCYRGETGRWTESHPKVIVQVSVVVAVRGTRDPSLADSTVVNDVGHLLFDPLPVGERAQALGKKYVPWLILAVVGSV